MTLNAYRAWLQQRERSAGTIEKYLRDTARFFRETGAEHRRLLDQMHLLL